MRNDSHYRPESLDTCYIYEPDDECTCTPGLKQDEERGLPFLTIHELLHLEYGVPFYRHRGHMHRIRFPPDTKFDQGKQECYGPWQVCNQYILVKEPVKWLDDDFAPDTPPAELLRFIKHQTPELCMEAVEQDGEQLRWVRIEQTEELCRVAIKKHYLAYQYVKNRSVALTCCEIKWKAWNPYRGYDYP